MLELLENDITEKSFLNPLEIRHIKRLFNVHK